MKARCGMSDAAALDDFGLLIRRTVRAHGGHLNDEVMDLIRARGSGVAHCPLSNVYFANAVFPLRAALEKSVRVGLGTDISGGYSAFLLDNARAAVTHSRMLEDGVDPGLPGASRGAGPSRVTYRDAFYLATKGGAEVLDLPVGAFEVGRQFDAILVRPPEDAGDGGDVLQKIVLRATPSDILSTWVAGRCVAGGSLLDT